MIDITRIWLEDNTIKYIQYGKVNRENNASNLVQIITNYSSDYSLGLSFQLPNGRFTRRYNTLHDLPVHIIEGSESVEANNFNEVEITEEIHNNFKVSENKIGEVWGSRFFLFPSTLIKFLATKYVEELPFSINIKKCLRFNEEDPDVCELWYKANTETNYLALFPTITAEYDEIEVDVASVQEEITTLINKSNQIISEFESINESIAEEQEKVGDLETNYNDLNDNKLDIDGGKASPNIDIRGVTFNYNRPTDAIQGAEYDEYILEEDNRFVAIEDDVKDIFDSLDLDGDL